MQSNVAIRASERRPRAVRAHPSEFEMQDSCLTLDHLGNVQINTHRDCATLMVSVKAKSSATGENRADRH
jgi:hypothetical protein